MRDPKFLSASALLAVLLVDPAGAQPASSAQPLPIAINSQQWCDGPSVPGTGCTAGDTHSFNVNDGQGFTASGSITAQTTADGKLVYSISGTANNASSAPRAVYVLTGQQVISFTVPHITIGGSVLPTTTVVADLTVDSSTLSGIQGRGFGPAENPVMSSAVLGPNSQLTPLFQIGAGSGGNFNQEIATLAAGDQIQGTLTQAYNLALNTMISGSFNESFTMQLRYIPEPSALLALSSGIAALAILVKRRLATARSPGA